MRTTKIFNSKQFSNYGSVCFILTVHTRSCVMLQVNMKSMITEAVLNEDNVKLDQACDTETNDDPFSDGETRGSLQSVSKSSIGYQSGCSTDTSETVEPDESMFVCGAAAHSHDLKQVDLTKLGSTEHMDSKCPNLG